MAQGHKRDSAGLRPRSCLVRHFYQWFTWLCKFRSVFLCWRNQTVEWHENWKRRCNLTTWLEQPPWLECWMDSTVPLKQMQCAEGSKQIERKKNQLQIHHEEVWWNHSNYRVSGIRKKNIGVNVDSYVWISIFKHRLTRQIK